MDDNQKLLLQRLAEDDKTLEAIRVYMLEDETPYNLSLNNEDLGATVRAIEVAKKMITQGLRDIKNLKVISRSEKQNENPGR